MRTPEQITNLRDAFSRTSVGSFAFLMSDDMVNNLADKIQDNINHRKFNWIIKVKTEENKDMFWLLITPEPTKPYCSIIDLSKKVEGLFSKYPKLLQIYARMTGDIEAKDVLIFERNTQSRK